MATTLTRSPDTFMIIYFTVVAAKKLHSRTTLKGGPPTIQKKQAYHSLIISNGAIAGWGGRKLSLHAEEEKQAAQHTETQ